MRSTSKQGTTYPTFVNEKRNSCRSIWGALMCNVERHPANVLLQWPAAKVYTRRPKSLYPTDHWVKWTITVNIHESLLSGSHISCVFRVFTCPTLASNHWVLNTSERTYTLMQICPTQFEVWFSNQWSQNYSMYTWHIFLYVLSVLCKLYLYLIDIILWHYYLYSFYLLYLL